MTMHPTRSRRPRMLPSARSILSVLMAATALTLFVVVIAVAPQPLELPLISLVSLGVAALIALLAWAFGSSRTGPDVTAWDVAGAFTLIGCAAAMLTQNEHALEYLLASKNK